jgi:hypothetical protein
MFQTDEILRLIVAHLAVPYGRPWPQGSTHPPAVGASQGLHVYFGGPLGTVERKTLAKLARVCRAWEEVALDALWREIPTVEPLFGLFPPSCMSGAHRHESVVSTLCIRNAEMMTENHSSNSLDPWCLVTGRGSATTHLECTESLYWTRDGLVGLLISRPSSPSLTSILEVPFYPTFNTGHGTHTEGQVTLSAECVSSALRSPA